MTSTNVSAAISEAQSALDEFVADGSVQEGAYVELSNHLKKIKEEKEESAEEDKKRLLTELIVANPFIIGTPVEDLDPLDIDLARRAIKLAKSKKCLSSDWWNEFINAYKLQGRDLRLKAQHGMSKIHKDRGAWTMLYGTCSTMHEVLM